MQIAYICIAMDRREKKTAALAIRVRPSLKVELERLAAADKRSLAGYIEIALQAHIDKQPKEKKTAEIVGGGRRA